MTGKYSIAGFPVIIDSVYDYVHRLCYDYRHKTPEQSELYIKTTQKEIDIERQKLRAESYPSDNLSDEYIESIAVYHKFCYLITQRGSLVIQGCAISSYGTAYLFTPDYNNTNDSKPYYCRFSSSTEIINEKNPIIKIEQDKVYVYSSPWCDKKIIKKNQRVPLSVICILTKSHTNQIEEINITSGYAAILRQCHSSTLPDITPGALNNLKRILQRVKLYSLSGNAEPSAAVVTFEGMKNKTKNTIL